MDTLITLYAPWYFAFLASWEDARKDGKLEITTIDYDELVADEAGVLHRAAMDLEPSIQLEKIERAVAANKGTADTQFNVGRPGRGRETMSADQMTRLEDMASLFLDDDLVARYVTGT